ncbi:MAG TPA: ABC transporter substrate-binding protein [Xanthobacteraceae bacterium]|nr:ABC transporter substrate-binding protein [Xanthobacteraceae bacterium]
MCGKSSIAARFVGAAGLLACAAAQAHAAEPVRIGIGFGLGFLPAYICEDQKLVEKNAKALHVEVKASYPRFTGVAPMQDALAARTIDVAPFGVAPLLAAWESGKGASQVLAVSGLTTLPLVLLGNRPQLRSLADLRAADRIAVPTLTSPQMYLLEMQSEKTLGAYDRLRGDIVVLPPSDAATALIAGSEDIAAYFSSAPFTEIALKDPKIHRMLSSQDIVGGKVSLLLMAATKGYVERNAKIVEAIDKAMDEAARLIRDDPNRAARIYLAHEPSKALDAPAVAAVLKDNRDEFGSAVHGIEVFADFMARHGELKAPPKSWQDVVAPALLHSPSS